jgi:hypothetical protein
MVSSTEKRTARIDEIEDNRRASNLSAPKSVDTPDGPGISGIENQEQKDKRDLVELRTEVTPDPDSVSGLPPGGREQIQEKDSAYH